MDLPRVLGLYREGDSTARRRELLLYINLKLSALGLPVLHAAKAEFLDVAQELLQHHREMQRLFGRRLCPADARIQAFIDDHVATPEDRPLIPADSLVLDRHGLARELALPGDGDHFANDYVQSYRVDQGVLHNPRHDRRTTSGVFHIAAGGLPIPADKKAVPLAVFARMLRLAFAATPEALMALPFTSQQDAKAATFVSLLLRPLVCPEVPGLTPERRMEVRFFAPGSLVSNLDFVESIFGNGGNPYAAEHDAGLDIEHWSGHTGCVVLAPHLAQYSKRELGLPAWADASERQRADGMCWRDGDERYNEGVPFKVTCRTAAGVMVTILADNYYGYCKKEVKTQISYAANLFGLCEEEHAGGAVAFTKYSLGDTFWPGPKYLDGGGHTFAEVVGNLGDRLALQPEGYGIDQHCPSLYYLPESARFDAGAQRVVWPSADGEQCLKLMPDVTYMHPSGYRVRFEKHPGAPSWRLVGIVADGVFCHKPCTVSGGGKSEISKSVTDSVLYGPFFVADFPEDMRQVDAIMRRDYSDRFKDPDHKRADDRRPLLSGDRSLGSVIKLLTPSRRVYTDSYNAWLKSIPAHIKSLVFIIKRFYRDEWGDDWQRLFSVDIVDGAPSHEFKYLGRKLVACYLRVGYDENDNWRTFKLRQDFVPVEKLQLEDDISVSVVVPEQLAEPAVKAPPGYSFKLVENCEFRLFQRPDAAIDPGMDEQAEADLARPGNFLSNYQPLTPADAREIVEDVLVFGAFTPAMRDRIAGCARRESGGYVASSSQPRLIDGVATKNPRYLQTRPDLAEPANRYMAEMAARLHARLPVTARVRWPVHAIVPGRRNNPADRDAGIRALSVYGPLHFQELPELFMDFICSLSGKSPSTTGAGSEGALTKAPFNALCPVTDLNNALVAFLLTGHHGWSTPAGYIGSRRRIDHDLSLLLPELWTRMTPAERDPRNLLAIGCLEKLEDFTFEGRTILASRLGYRITGTFRHMYLGRIFNNPAVVFDEAMLRPESQSEIDFAEGIESIVEAQRRVARTYFADGSIAGACPPLQALLHIMADGTWNGHAIESPEVRQLFTREYLLASDWYAARLQRCQANHIELCRRQLTMIEAALASNRDQGNLPHSLAELRAAAVAEHERVSAPAYLALLHGTIGADLLFGAPALPAPTS